MSWEEVGWVEERSSFLTRRLLKLLSDGQWHDREEIVQAAIGSVNAGTALRYAQKRRYHMAKYIAKRRGVVELEEFLQLYPSPGSYPPMQGRTRDENHQFFVGARFLILDRLNKNKQIEKRMHNGAAQVRRVGFAENTRRRIGLKGGGAAPRPE